VTIYALATCMLMTEALACTLGCTRVGCTGGLAADGRNRPGWNRPVFLNS